MSEIKLGIILGYVQMALRLSGGFFLAPFLLASLGKSEFGIYTIAGTIITWLALCDFGLSASTTKFLAEYQARKDADGEAHCLGIITLLFSCCGIAVFLMGLGLFPFLGNIFDKFTDDELHLYKILYILTLLNTAFMFPGRALSGLSAARQKFTVPGYMHAAQSFLNIGGSFVILFLGYRSIALTVFGIVTGILLLIWNIWYCFGTLKARVTWSGMDFPLCKSLFAFSIWMFLDKLTGMMNWGFGNTIIGMTQGAEEIAIFTYGMMIMQYYFTVSGGISQYFFPRVVKIVQTNNDTTELTNLWIRVGRVQLMIMLPMFMGFIFFGKLFLTLWVGPTLESGTHAAWWVAVILMCSITIPQIQSLGYLILQAKNLMRNRVTVLSCVAFANLVFGYVLSMYYGSVGLAVASALSLVMGHWIFLNFLYSHKVKLDLWRFWRSVAKGLPLPLLLLCCIGFAIVQLSSFFAPSWILLIICASAFSLIYGIIILLFYAGSEERAMLPHPLQCIFRP